MDFLTQHTTVSVKHRSVGILQYFLTYWHSPRGWWRTVDVDAPSLQAFKARLDVALGSLGCWLATTDTSSAHTAICRTDSILGSSSFAWKWSPGNGMGKAATPHAAEGLAAACCIHLSHCSGHGSKDELGAFPMLSPGGKKHSSLPTAMSIFSLLEHKRDK